MSNIAPGWYKDPADTTTQRYWDGEGWLGDPLPADATPPPGPPPSAPKPAPALLRPDITMLPAPAHPAPALPRMPAGTSTPGGVRPPTAMPNWLTYAGAPPRPHGLALAGVGSRLVARIVDTIAVLALCVVANAWFAIEWWRSFQPYFNEAMRRALAGESAAGMPQPEEKAGTLLLLIFVVTTAVWFAYEVPGSANSGQTLGKRLLGIKVMRMESDERLGFGRAWRRWSRLGLPTLLWYCCGIGLLLQFFDCLFVAIDRPLHQALHDKAAGTVVVQVGRSPTPERR